MEMLLTCLQLQLLGCQALASPALLPPPVAVQIWSVGAVGGDSVEGVVRLQVLEVGRGLHLASEEDLPASAVVQPLQCVEAGVPWAGSSRSTTDQA